MAIHLQNVSKSFQKTKIIHQLNLDVKDGSIFGLIGPSGGGKTTIIKMMLGMLPADEGTITVLEHEVPHEPLLYQIGYMAQADALYTDLTGHELIHLKNNGKTILLTTHAMDEAAQCDELAMLREGSIIANGSPSELLEQFGVVSLDDVFLQAGGVEK